MRTELRHITCLLFLRAKKPVSIAPAVLCSGLTNEIQCLIVITRKDLALRTKTNQQASSKENRMEVRLVTAASRGFFFSLAWITIAASPLTIAASLRKKKPSSTQGIATLEGGNSFFFCILFIFY